MNTKRVYYLGGMKKGGHVILGGQAFAVPNKIGEYLDLPDWAAKDIVAQYEIAGAPMFTLNKSLAARIARGDKMVVADGRLIPGEREYTEEELVAKLEAVRARKQLEESLGVEQDEEEKPVQKKQKKVTTKREIEDDNLEIQELEKEFS